MCIACIDFSYMCFCSSSSSSLCMHSNSITFHNSHFDIWALEARILSCSQPSERHTYISAFSEVFTFQPSLKCQDCLSGFAVSVAELARLHSCDDLIAHIYKLVSVEPLLRHLATVKMLIIKSSCKCI